MTRAVSHFVASAQVPMASSYKNYIDFYIENRKSLPYQLAFVSGSPSFYRMTFEIPPGFYPVSLRNKMYQIPFPWQYLTLTFNPTLGGGRWESGVATCIFTARPVLFDSGSKSVLPPYLPNYDYSNYCIGWTHEVLNSSTIDHVHQAVDEMFALHFGLAINMDMYRFVTEWLFFKLCHDLFDTETYQFWTNSMPGYIGEWSTSQIGRYPEYLAALETLTPEWFLDLPVKSNRFLDVHTPRIVSRHFNGGTIETYPFNREVASTGIIPGDALSPPPHLPVTTHTVRFSATNPKTWNVFNTKEATV